MDRRFLTVLGMSVILALVVAGIFYQITSSNSGRKPVSEMKDLVIAAEPLNLGVSIKPNQLKVIKIPVEAFPKNAFTKVEEVIDRPVISNILAEEPILEGRLAPRGSGIGLAPKIPTGMRALAIRVNEVVGVAGFVLPGMRVDVLVTGRPPGASPEDITTTVLQNIEVLSANQQVQPDARGQAIAATVVTLLVTPEQAELMTLAGQEGRIQLVLRNAVDQKVVQTPGKMTGELYGLRKQRPVQTASSGRPRPRREAAPPPPPPPAPVVVPEEIIMIRGNTKTVEVIGQKKVQP